MQNGNKIGNTVSTLKWLLVWLVSSLYRHDNNSQMALGVIRSLTGVWLNTRGYTAGLSLDDSLHYYG